MITEVPIDPSDSRWGVPRWPEWVTSFRPNQIEAWEEIIELYAHDTDVVLLDAPTGTGKTIIAEGMRRLLTAPASAYVANTNSLLDQFMSDFSYADPLKGKRNYPTADHPEHFTLRGEEALTCADCMPSMAVIPACSVCPQDNIDEEDERRSLHCPHCHPFASCPYRSARGRAAESALVVTNTSYFVADTQLSANSILAGRDFVVVDECDTLESILMGHIEVNISKRMAQELDLQPPERKTVEEAWAVWLEDEAKPKIKAAIDLHKTRKNGTKEWLRKRDRLARLNAKLQTLAVELANGNAVYDGYDKGDIIFRPVKVDTAAPNLLWNQARRWLCMSATLFPDEFVDSMGLNHTDLNVSVVRVPSTFPVERRPIYFKNIANNTYKERDTAWPAMANGIRRVLASRPEARTLIHTVSYGFTQFLDSELSWDWSGVEGYGEREVIACLKAGDRGDTIDQLKKSEGGVLLGPGFDRGIDLPGEDCELIIIPKIPYASTNDKQVQKRMYSGSAGQIWYATQTLKSLVQMTGRGMRSEDDLCECVSPETRILTRDLLWIPAGDLKKGDAIMGFSETTSRQVPRRWEDAIVEATGIKIRPRMEIMLRSGKTLIATPSHKWVSKWGQARDDKWVRTDQLRPGHHLNLYVDPWEQINTRDVGWLEGFCDGEGCLVLRQGDRNPTVTGIMISQNPGPVMDKAEVIAASMGFSTKRFIHPSKECQQLKIQGGFAEHLRFLGQVRPIRLLNKFQVRSRFQSEHYDEVIKVRDIGEGPIVTLQSSSGTYVAEGYGAHNTFILDGQFMTNIWRKSRWLLPHWWVESVDFGGGGI